MLPGCVCVCVRVRVPVRVRVCVIHVIIKEKLNWEVGKIKVNFRISFFDRFSPQ